MGEAEDCCALIPGRSYAVGTLAAQDPNPVDPALGPGLLQAPWRMEYLDAMKDSAGKGGESGGAGDGGPAQGAGSGGSFLRDYWLKPHDDVHNHVIVRSALGMVLLNRYPYANGHLLVALAQGRPRLLDYDAVQRAHLWMMTDLAADLVETALSPQGINIGVNQGHAAGAGVPGHLHVHLVPRWGGDVNFITVVGRVRVIPGSLEAMAQRYAQAWARLKQRWPL